MATAERQGFLLPVIEWMLRRLSWCSAYEDIVRLMRRIGKWPDEELIPFWFAEGYTLGWLTLLAAVFAFAPLRSCFWWAFLGLAGYRLFDLGLGLSRIIVFHLPRRRDDQGSYILVRNAIRWLALTVINVSEAIICFSFAYLTWGAQYEPLIDTRIGAIYQSLTTFITLGWATPTTDAARATAIAQLCYFIFLFIVIVPVVISVVRAKERTREVFGEDVERDRRG